MLWRGSRIAFDSLAVHSEFEQIVCSSFPPVGVSDSAVFVEMLSPKGSKRTFQGSVPAFPPFDRLNFHCHPDIEDPDFWLNSSPDGRDESTLVPSTAKRICFGYVQHQQPAAFRGVENIHPFFPSENWTLSVLPVQLAEPELDLDGHDSSGTRIDSMDVEQGGSASDRFARFPPRTQRSPTYWHKATAVGGAIFELQAQRSLPLDDSRVRTWECSYGGCSDIY